METSIADIVFLVFRDWTCGVVSSGGFNVWCWLNQSITLKGLLFGSCAETIEPTLKAHKKPIMIAELRTGLLSIDSNWRRLFSLDRREIDAQIWSRVSVKNQQYCA